MTSTVNVEELRKKVQDVYRAVATEPGAGFHFEVGRPLAERLGYDPALLDRVPAPAVDSFAGVGCPFVASFIEYGATVLDLGSGSGMDSCVAAVLAGKAGRVIGIDMTDEQLHRAQEAAQAIGLDNVEFRKGYIESLPVEDESIDLVISNGVINLVADKPQVFREIARVLKPGGQMAISDIVSERELTESIKCDASLWAACIGGASQEDGYLDAIRESGLLVESIGDNGAYRFLSSSAQKASADYGVKSVTVVARKPE